MTDDAQLFTEVRALPDVQARAAMLGLDWDALRAARSRLLLGAWLISIALALIALAQPAIALVGFLLASQEPWDARGFLIQILGGGVGGYVVRQLSMYIARRVALTPLRGPDLRREVTVATVVQAMAFPILTLAVCFLGSEADGWILGVAVVAPVVTVLELRPLTHFPIFLAQNSSVVGAVYTRMRAVSPLESLLGLRVRWLLVRHLGVSLFALGATSLVVTNGLFVFPVVAVAVVLDFAGARLTLSGRPVAASWVQLVLGVVVAGAATIIDVAALLAHASTGIGPLTV